MTYSIVEVSCLEEAEQGLYGMITSRSRVVRTGLTTAAYALKLARTLEGSEENRCDMSYFEVRDSSGALYVGERKSFAMDCECPF